MFYKALKEVNGDESKIHVVYGKIQISFFVGSAMAAKYTPEGEGLAGEGWAQSSVRLSFKAVVNSS